MSRLTLALAAILVAACHPEWVPNPAHQFAKTYDVADAMQPSAPVWGITTARPSNLPQPDDFSWSDERFIAEYCDIGPENSKYRQWWKKECFEHDMRKKLETKLNDDMAARVKANSETSTQESSQATTTVAPPPTIVEAPSAPDQNKNQVQQNGMSIVTVNTFDNIHKTVHSTLTKYPFRATGAVAAAVVGCVLILACCCCGPARVGSGVASVLCAPCTCAHSMVGARGGHAGDMEAAYHADEEGGHVAIHHHGQHDDEMDEEEEMPKYHSHHMIAE